MKTDGDAFEKEKDGGGRGRKVKIRLAVLRRKREVLSFHALRRVMCCLHNGSGRWRKAYSEQRCLVVSKPRQLFVEFMVFQCLLCIRTDDYRRLLQLVKVKVKVKYM